MKNKLKANGENVFESIKHVDEFGFEFWYARDLQKVLEYKEWRKLNRVIEKAKGVKNFDKFTNAGYRGLYGGEDANKIAKRKNIIYRGEILDYMGSEELANNIFRIAQTESLLKKQKVISEKEATNTHYIVGNAVRETIKKLGGTLPEKLPTPDKSIKELEGKKRIRL